MDAKEDTDCSKQAGGGTDSLDHVLDLGKESNALASVLGFQRRDQVCIKSSCACDIIEWRRQRFLCSLECLCSESGG
jgi:hypothetical protein